jgi:hypothetical protein
MNHQVKSLRREICSVLFCFGMLAGNWTAHAGDNAALVSVTITNNTPMLPRTVFIQTWTFTNTGTTTWSPTYSGYTLNVVTTNSLLRIDNIGAVPLTNKTYTSYKLTTPIVSGQSVAPGATASFSLSFITPETPGSYTNTFQLNSASSVFFGPQVTVQINVLPAGSTNQYDRARAVSYANNYAGYVVADGYFWTNSGNYFNYGAGAPVPTAFIGDDCAHFVSCCIGRESHLRGGGLPIPSRVPPTYGEPGATKLVNDVLIAPGYAKEVFSLSDMQPGDVIGWNWAGDTNIANLDHVTLYLGNGLTASHAASCLDVSATTWYSGVHHYIHILDAPTLVASRVGNNFILSWGTNWAGYALYSSTNLSAGAAWTKVSQSPVVVGKSNVVTNTVTPGAVLYRLVLP